MDANPTIYERRSVQWKAILFAALLAGTLDIIGAVIVYQANPTQVFKFIASGAFGAGRAFSGGSDMVAWGIAFHYIISLAWTIAFFFIYPLFPILSKNKYITGALYGIVIWVVMNKVIIPLSAIPPAPFNLRSAAIAALILIVAVGLPIAILTHRYYSRKGIGPS